MATKLWNWIRARLTCTIFHNKATPYSPSSPTTNSSDTTSPIYPDRPIRPLPKRPLRSRLSPEVAGTIRYPPAPASSSLFYPYNQTAFDQKGESLKLEVAGSEQELTNVRKPCNGDTVNGYQFRGSDLESDEDDGLGIVRRYEDQQRQAMAATPSKGYTNGTSRSYDPLSQSVVSSNDSVDGYDSFENTNNKKKRKVPTSGNLGSHHSSLSLEMANMGISPAQDGDSFHVSSENSNGPYYSSISQGTLSNVIGTGISGAGRGRYGRSGRREASGRSPLGVSTNASNAWQLGRLNMRREYNSTGTTTGNDQVINFSRMLTLG